MSPCDNAQVGACRLRSTEPSEGVRGEGDGIGSRSGLGGGPEHPESLARVRQAETGSEGVSGRRVRGDMAGRP